MTKIDIFSGFLGAGKTTLIKKLIKEAYAGEKLMLIENEFGEIGVDGGFLQDAGVEITEMNSGCICCSLVGDFGKALTKALNDYAPDRILIEPSGVGKLSDVIRAVLKIDTHDVELDGFTAVVDAGKCKMYMKNFGEFFNDQVEHAGTIVLSRTGDISEEKLKTCLELLKAKNDKAVIITTPWDQLDGKQIAKAIERKDTLSAELQELMEEHEEDEDHCCDHDHDHEHHHDHDHEHEHHHEHDHEHEHHHDHDDDDECGCGEHHHHDHHHHHADEVFASWGAETAKKFTAEEIDSCLNSLEETKEYGVILRAKGIVPAKDGSWIYFDYVPGEKNIRQGSAAITGRLCVIGSEINESGLKELFGV
ncbi:MAG: GTP-binding protein [Clostridiales bacterium]|nr:GTP-binding protein [Clostridiales bacterium]